MSATAARAGRRVATGTSRVERSEETRAALLRSASRLICELGMHGASIDRIAADAGYTKGAFYAHFASKEDLFLVVLDEHFATELARLDVILAGAEDPAEEARKAAEDFLAHIDADPQWRRVYQEFATHAARHDAFRVELPRASVGCVPAWPRSSRAGLAISASRRPSHPRTSPQ